MSAHVRCVRDGRPCTLHIGAGRGRELSVACMVQRLRSGMTGYPEPLPPEAA
jgi:hypothetical protein